MAIVAEFTTGSECFPLGKALATVRDATVEIERVKSVDSTVVVYFWIGRDSPDSPELDVEQFEIFESVVLIDQLEGELLYRATFAEGQEDVLIGISHFPVTLESAIMELDEWCFRLRAETVQGLSEFHNYCQEHGFKLKLTEFPVLDQMYSGARYNLTDKQRDVLIQAYVEGFFEQPREATLEEVGEPFGITPQATLARLRNGKKNLLESTIVRSADERA